MYIKTVNGHVDFYPYSIADFKNQHKNTSFPSELSSSFLKEHGIFPVATTAAPSFDPRTQVLEEYPEFVDGSWRQAWRVKNMEVEQAARNIRAIRNTKLKNCDWTQASDSPVDKTLWAAYRQNLRDITKQPGFPFSIVWPTEPQN